ncbi:MAG: acylphosphatase [Nocardioidaceae bacterium]|nr:acylphosphatase [Nocardioidaceae bacterium]
MSDDVNTIARAVVVHGHVQGVWFRGACQAEAQRLNVVGWVANEFDGTVRAHVQGTPTAVESLLDWMRVGPRHARVDRVDVGIATPEKHRGFLVR